MEDPAEYNVYGGGPARCVWDIETVPTVEYIDGRAALSMSFAGQVLPPAVEYIDGRAALSPLTGRVAMIGVRRWDGTSVTFEGDDERNLLEAFLRWSDPVMNFIGFNSVAFDLAFVVRRAWILGIDNELIEHLEDAEHTDLMRLWMREDQQRISLRRLVEALGTGQKIGYGKDFAGMDRDHRIEYLKRDLYLTARCAHRMVPCCENMQFPEDQ